MSELKLYEWKTSIEWEVLGRKVLNCDSPMKLEEYSATEAVYDYKMVYHISKTEKIGNN